jgi:hypothetical protein
MCLGTGGKKESAMKLKLFKTAPVWMWWVIAISCVSAMAVLSVGSQHKFDEGLVKAAKKLRF